MYALQCKPVSPGTTADASRRGSLASAGKLPVRSTPTIGGGMLHLGISGARNPLALRESLHSRLRSGTRIFGGCFSYLQVPGAYPPAFIFACVSGETAQLFPHIPTGRYGGVLGGTGVIGPCGNNSQFGSPESRFRGSLRRTPPHRAND